MAGRRVIEVFHVFPRGEMRPNGEKLKGDRSQVVKGRAQLCRDTDGCLGGQWPLITGGVQMKMGHSLAVMRKTESWGRGAEGKSQRFSMSFSTKRFL